MILRLLALVFTGIPRLKLVANAFAAGEAPRHDPPHVSLLIHLAAAQAPTRLQERQRVSPAAQVRDACHMMPSYPI